MNTIEGFTPGMMWDAVIVLIGLATIAVLIDKVADIFRKESERKKAREQLSRNPVTDVETRLDELDDEVKVLERKVRDLEKAQGTAEDGFAAMGTAVLAILNHLIHNGNGEEMLTAQSQLNEYLLRRK